MDKEESKIVDEDINPTFHPQEETKEENISPPKSQPRLKKKGIISSKTTKKSVEYIEQDNSLTFFSLGTAPIDGENPQIFSTKGIFNKYCFLLASDDLKLKAPAPTYLNEAELYSAQKVEKDDFFDGWEFLKDGCIKYIDKDLLERQRGVLFSVIKKLAKSIFDGNIIGLALPIRINEPRSFSDRMGEFWRMAPHFLNKAAKIADKTERIKLILTWNVSSLHCLLRKMKSFNPLLGETFQGQLSDGTKIYAEQSSHHPPILHYLVKGPNDSYTCSGYLNITIKFRPNKGLLSLITKCKIELGGHTVYSSLMPLIKMTGMISGDRKMRFIGPITCWDPTLSMKGVVFINYGLKQGTFGSKKTVPKNELEGIVYIASKPPNEEPRQSRRIQDLTDVKKEIARASGKWNSFIEFNGVRYWDVDKFREYPVIFDTNPLPSDFRFREDLIWLRRNNMEYGDLWKDALEIRQRKDKKLRETYAKKHKI